MKIPKQVYTAAGKVNPAQVIATLLNLVQEHLERAKSREIEKTERERAQQQILAHVQMIEDEQKIFVEYFSREMALRQELCKDLLEILDCAERYGDMESFRASIENILRIATSDPIRNSLENIKGTNII